MLRPDILFCLIMLIAIAICAFIHQDIDERFFTGTAAGKFHRKIPPNPDGQFMKDKVIELLKI